MNVFVFTVNHFLFKGIENALNENNLFHSVHASTSEFKRKQTLKTLTADDILLLIDDGGKFDFRFLIDIARCPARVIYSCPIDNFHFQQIFGFTVLKTKFYLSDLVLALNMKTEGLRKLRLPCMTPQEQSVLFHTLRGNTVEEIADILGIGTKVVYHHQRNALRKIGLRKARDVSFLPRNFIDYMYLRPQA